jgi:hypothetical protein
MPIRQCEQKSGPGRLFFIESQDVIAAISSQFGSLDWQFQKIEDGIPEDI